MCIILEQYIYILVAAVRILKGCSHNACHWKTEPEKDGEKTCLSFFYQNWERPYGRRSSSSSRSRRLMVAVTRKRERRERERYISFS